jgi:hypothetical protein
MSIGIGLALYIAIGIFGAWLDLTDRMKRPSLYFGLGSLAMMVFFAALFAR